MKKVINRVPLLKMVFIKKMKSNQKETYCLGNRHYSKTVSQIVYEKLNPKFEKFFEIIIGKSSICARSKSQIFTK